MGPLGTANEPRNADGVLDQPVAGPNQRTICPVCSLLCLLSSALCYPSHVLPPQRTIREIRLMINLENFFIDKHRNPSVEKRVQVRRLYLVKTFSITIVTNLWWAGRWCVSIQSRSAIWGGRSRTCDEITLHYDFNAPNVAPWCRVSIIERKIWKFSLYCYYNYKRFQGLDP